MKRSKKATARSAAVPTAGGAAQAGRKPQTNSRRAARGGKGKRTAKSPRRAAQIAGKTTAERAGGGTQTNCSSTAVRAGTEAGRARSKSSPSLKAPQKSPPKIYSLRLCGSAGSRRAVRAVLLSQSGGGGRHFRRAARGRRGSLFFCEKKTTENAGRKFQNAKPSAGSRKADGRRTA